MKYLVQLTHDREVCVSKCNNEIEMITTQFDDTVIDVTAISVDDAKELMKAFSLVILDLKK